MLNYQHRTAAAIAAVLVVLVSWVQVITIPPAQAAVLISPVLA